MEIANSGHTSSQFRHFMHFSGKRISGEKKPSKLIFLLFFNIFFGQNSIQKKQPLQSPFSIEIMKS
jgi:hypothetical protein